MIYKYIKNSYRQKFFRSVIYVMIFAFTFTTTSCYTTKNAMVRPEALNSEETYKILKAVMNDGSVIDFKGCEVMYSNNYKNQKNVIVYSVQETTKVQSGIYNVTSGGVRVLELKSIQSLIVEKEETNSGMTLLATVGVIALVGVIVIAIVAISNDDKSTYTAPRSTSGGEKYSCPFIYSYDGEKYIFDGEPYGGAITEGLKKTDYSRLDNLKYVDGKYKILLRNETDETQHTDEMKLLVLNHPVNTEAAIDYSGNISVFEKAFPPLSVTDENGKDLSVFFKSRDNIQWQTIMPDDEKYNSNNLRHEIIVKYPKPKDSGKVKLLVNAGTSIWGENMVKNMLDMKGNNIDNWYKEINNKGQEKMEFHKFMEREEMYLLKVNVLENDTWVTRGSISNSGPYKDEDRIIELNTENVTGDTLCIKLNPPFGFWKFDFAGLIYESEFTSVTTELPVSLAIDETSLDVKESLNGIDGEYYSMAYLTNFAKIEFDAPVPDKNLKQTMFLQTTGYYEIHLKKDKPEQVELLEKIFNTPGAILEISMNEYYKKMKELGFTEK